MALPRRTGGGGDSAFGANEAHGANEAGGGGVALTRRTEGGFGANVAHGGGGVLR